MSSQPRAIPDPWSSPMSANSSQLPCTHLSIEDNQYFNSSNSNKINEHAESTRNSCIIEVYFSRVPGIANDIISHPGSASIMNFSTGYDPGERPLACFAQSSTRFAKVTEFALICQADFLNLFQ